MNWTQAQKWEQNWWGYCFNTLFEEEKQLIYANKMGLELLGNEKTPYVFDLQGKSILDVGGGAVSLLLKCINHKGSVVVDPLPMPKWVVERYTLAGIKFLNFPAEQMRFDKNAFDEAWIYNCLQHTESPKRIVQNTRYAAKITRVFEWLDTPISDGHIHSLTEEDMNVWFGGYGRVEVMNKRPCIGKAYYGVFI